MAIQTRYQLNTLFLLVLLGAAAAAESLAFSVELLVFERGSG